MERLRRALKIRHGEGAVVLRLLALMLVAWTGFALGGSGVESLFFARFGARHLPWMYIAVGLVTFPTTLAVTALLGRGRRGAVLVSLPLALAALVLAMRGLLLLPGRWVYPVLWLAMMVAWIVLGITAWGLAGLTHDTRQAKRLFPLYGAGIILGGAVGGAATAPLAAWVGAENLLLFWAAAMGGSSILAASVIGRRGPGARHRRGAPRAPRASVIDSMREGYRSVRRSTLLRWMAASMLLLGLLYFSLSLPFAVAATGRFPTADRLAGFLGLFTGAVNAVALAVSLVAANRLFARFGVATMVVTFPLIYLVGFAALVVTDTFPTLVAFRFVQLVWMYGVWTTGWQAVWGVVPPEHRDQARTFLEGGPFQAGVVLAGILLLIGQRTLSARQLFGIAAVVAVTAVVTALRTRRAYSGAIVEALRAGWPEVFVPEEEPFGGVPWDRAGLAALEAGARDEDPGVRRIAVSILSQMNLPDGVELCRRAVDDPDPAVRAAAAGGIARAPDPAAALLRLLRDEAPEVRAAAAEAVDRAASGAGLDEVLRVRLEEMLSDPDGHARVRAAVALHGHTGEPRAADAIRSMTTSPDPAVRSRAVAALRRVDPSAEEPISFLNDPDPAVRRAAASALAGSSERGVVQALLASLGDDEPTVREAAAWGLAASGGSVIGDVVASLRDEDRAEGALLALAQMPSVDPAPIREYALAEAAQARKSHRLWQAIATGDDDRGALLAFALRHRATAHARRAYAALVPLGDHSSLQVALENLDNRDPTQRANALESFESEGDPEIVRPLLPVWEPEPRPDTDRITALETLLRDPDAWIRACAALAAGGDGQRLRKHLTGLADADPDPFVRETARRTLEGATVETLSTLPLMDRILALRQVPLFRELSPEDLKHVAEAATERLYPDGSLLAELGDPGDAMHVVVTGMVRVLLPEAGRGDIEVARRGPGYIVGEMAILSDQPRMASLLAVGDVRTLSLDRGRFQRILRERPDAALAVMRELCARLREAHTREPIDPTTGAS